MKTLYLLPFNEQEVQFSFDKNVLEQSLQIEKGLPNKKILEVNINDDLADKLQNPFEPSPTREIEIPSRYYSQRKSFLINPPDWHKTEGLRIYIIFDKQQRCFWSPSGNNLNSFYKRNPESFLNEAIRVEIDDDSYVNLMAFFEWSCDNF